MVRTTSTSIRIMLAEPKEVAMEIRLWIKPIVLRPWAKTPAATSSITTPAKASAIPRYATSRPENTF
ncbi:hypothetical protein D3C72_1330550 [compost metagenome]